MDGYQLCAILAATEADVKTGSWPAVKVAQDDILGELQAMEAANLQQVADWVFWAKVTNECIENGLVTGPTIKAAGAERVVELAKARGLKVPKNEDPREAFFDQAQSP